MATILSKLDGYKTHLAMAAAFLTALARYLNHEIGVSEFVQLVFFAMGGSALRAAKK